MAADQRKKRVNAASLVGCTSHEKYKAKRKKLESPQPDLNMIPTISLEWDNKKKSVVPKIDQIGISQRHLIPFIEPGPHSLNILADVSSVPQEIFELENLSEILSYEVWQSLLSKNERSLLSQFLPKEAVPDTFVRELLAGDNFHFGNPFLTWGASLCLGELHPDNVLHKEQSLKACKKEYYSDLQKYHNDMIGNLQLWKEKWASCKDPEVDVVQKILRSRNHAEKIIPPLETGLRDSEENLVASPDSCSWPNSEKAYSSDNQNCGMMHGELERRKDCLKKIGDNSVSGQSLVTKHKKGEKLLKRNIQRGDGAKYMSYFKVSKQQHERVKSSMKHAGNSIQPRSLNNVLGTIDALNVQPFERFEEEEKKNLHDYWLKLANKDISEGFANWRKRQLLRQQLILSLGAEMGQKLEPEEVTLDENEGSQDKLMEHSDDSKEGILPTTTIEGTEKEQSDNLLPKHRDIEEPIHKIAAEQEDEKGGMTDYVFAEQVHDTDKIKHSDDMPDHVFIQDPLQQEVASLDNSPRVGAMVIETPNPVVLQDQHQQQIGSFNGNPRINPLVIDSHDNSASAESDEDPPIVSEYSGNLNHMDIPVSQGGALTSGSDVWPAGDVHGSYYQSTAANDGYASGQELTLAHPQFIQEQPVRLIDLETNRQDKDAGKDMLCRQSDHTSFFNSYSNQDRNELLQSFFKGQSSLSYHHVQKQLGLDFQPGNDIIMEAGQFHGHLTEQVPPSHLDLRQKRLNDLYMHQTIQESMYSDGSRYTMGRQEDHMPVNMHDWATVNAVRMAAASQPHLNSGELSQNWYSSDNGVQDVWPPFESAVGVNHGLGSGRSSDQSLFSVLTECNELRPGAAAYGSMGSAERLIHIGNYSGIGEVIPPSSSVPQAPPNAFNYLSGHEASAGAGAGAGAGVKMNNLGWMGIPQQNSGIQESMGKPFLRSWNQ